jgi:GNAT superfamily N-acetyltransferase
MTWLTDLRNWLAARTRRESTDAPVVDHLCRPCLSAEDWQDKTWACIESPRALALRSALDGFAYGGVHCKTVAMELLVGGRWVLLFVDEVTGDLAGGVELRLREDSDTATIEALDVFPAWQKRRIARAVNARLEDALREVGVREITLYATRGGCYAWAALDYDFHSPDALRKHVEDVRHAMDGEVLAGHATTEQVQALFAGLESGEIVSAREVSQYGRQYAWSGPNGRERWLGRMPFEGWKWQAVKRVEPRST